jgi:hypothetical protein
VGRASGKIVIDYWPYRVLLFDCVQEHLVAKVCGWMVKDEINIVK